MKHKLKKQNTTINKKRVADSQVSLSDWLATTAQKIPVQVIETIPELLTERIRVETRFDGDILFTNIIQLDEKRNVLKHSNIEIPFTELCRLKDRAIQAHPLHTSEQIASSVH